MVNHRLGLLACCLLTACTSTEKRVFSGPTPGIEYHNQNTAPWPWVSAVPSERALALKEVDFDDVSRQLHFDMALIPYQYAFQDVRIVLLDYTILPEEVSKDNVRPPRYFMVASFFKIGNSPPSPPDFEITTSLNTAKAAPQEAMLFMIRDIVDEVRILNEDCLLTPGRKITINLD